MFDFLLTKKNFDKMIRNHLSSLFFAFLLGLKEKNNGSPFSFVEEILFILILIQHRKLLAFTVFFLILRSAPFFEWSYLLGEKKANVLCFFRMATASNVNEIPINLEKGWWTSGLIQSVLFLLFCNKAKNLKETKQMIIIRSSKTA